MRIGAERWEDRLRFGEPPYRSRGEAQLGRLFENVGIPFQYEQPRYVYDRGRRQTWHPDFTLPSYRDLIVEYAGMSDRPDYMAALAYKQAAYRANDLPAVFLYPSDLAGCDWRRRVVGRLDDAYQDVRQTYHAYPPSRAQASVDRRSYGLGCGGGYTVGHVGSRRSRYY